MVCMYSICSGMSTKFWSSDVTSVEITITTVTAMPMPTALVSFEDTPRKGQMPKNCANTMLLTKIAVMIMAKYSSMALYDGSD